MTADIFGAYAALVPATRPLTVAIMADASSRAQVVPWFTRFADQKVHVIAPAAAPEWDLDGRGFTFHPATSIGQRAGQLKLIGPPHVVVDVTDSAPADHAALWRRLFLHLAQHGVYVLDRRSEASATYVNAISSWYVSLVDAADPDAPPALKKAVREIIASTGGVSVTRDLVIVSKRLRHFLKVRHNEAHKVLGAREPRLKISVLQTLPKGVVRSAADVHLHRSETTIEHLDPELPYPSLHLRHYTGRISFLGAGLFFTGSSILPDSFRHHLLNEPVNPKIQSVSPSFARIAWKSRPTRRVEGSFYNLDSAYSGHFGHLTTEVISRLWGWDEAKRAIPDLKALIHIDHENQRDPVLEQRIFAAYGIEPDDVVCLTEPAVLGSVVSATPMWHNAEPHYVHPGMVDVWRRLTTGLRAPDVPTHEKIFVSRGRQLKRRACRNADEVEHYFAAHGFTVIYPEELDLGHQVALFADATTIAGFAGSAMFNIMHTAHLETLIILGHESYTARNEHLFTSLLGPTVHYLWSAADIEHGDDAWRQDAFYSDWSFDFERNHSSLEELMAQV